MPAMSTTVSTAVLKNVPMFASFPEEPLRVLSTVVTRRSAPRGTTVMAAGDPIDSLYIVISGRRSGRWQRPRYSYWRSAYQCFFRATALDPINRSPTLTPRNRHQPLMLVPQSNRQ